MTTFNIAILPGEGIGSEVAPKELIEIDSLGDLAGQSRSRKQSKN